MNESDIQKEKEKFISLGKKHNQPSVSSSGS